jgi:hypothetical protein
MPQVGFEPTIPAFERVKKVHALDGAAIVIGTFSHSAELLAAELVRYIPNWKAHMFPTRSLQLSTFRLPRY